MTYDPCLSSPDVDDMKPSGQGIAGRLLPQAPRIRSRLVLPALLAGLAAVSGCGGGRYEERFEKTVKDVAYDAPFNALYKDPVTIPATGVRIRVPRLFTGANPEGDASKQTRVDPLKAMRQRMPGVSVGYEATATDAEKAKMPFYLGLTAVEIESLKGEFPFDQVQALLKAALPATGNWEDAQVNAPTQGASVAWRKLRIEGDVVMDRIMSSGDTEFKAYPTVIEIWVHQSPTYFVILDWTVPKSIESQVPLETLAGTTAGTVEIGPKPAVPEAAQAAAAQ